MGTRDLSTRPRRPQSGEWRGARARAVVQSRRRGRGRGAARAGATRVGASGPVIERGRWLFGLRQVIEAHRRRAGPRRSRGRWARPCRRARRGRPRDRDGRGRQRRAPDDAGPHPRERRDRNVDCETIRQPVGVCAAIAPFNFPAMVPFWFLPFAIACGNTFVLKPSEQVPLTQELVFKLIDEHGGLPDGVRQPRERRRTWSTPCSTTRTSTRSRSSARPRSPSTCTSAPRATGKRVQALGGAKNFMVVMPDASSTKTVCEHDRLRLRLRPASAAWRASSWSPSATRTSR